SAASAAVGASSSASAVINAGAPGALAIILILVSPVLALVGPVLFVVADEAFHLEAPQQLRRVAPLLEVGDLDLQALLLADDGVDVREAGLAQQAPEAPVQVHQRRLAEGAHRLDQRRPQPPRLDPQ